MKIKILILIFVALTSQAWAQPLQAGFVGPWQWLIIVLVPIIIYRMIKSLLKVIAGNKGGEDRLEKLQLLRAKDLITEEEYEKEKEEIIKKL